MFSQDLCVSVTSHHVSSICPHRRAKRKLLHLWLWKSHCSTLRLTKQVCVFEVNVIISFPCSKGSQTSKGLGVSSVNGGARQAGVRATSSHLLKTSVLIFPVVNGVVQEGLLFWWHVLRLISVAEAGHLRLRGASSRRLGAVVNAVAEVDHKTWVDGSWLTHYS